MYVNERQYPTWRKTWLYDNESIPRADAAARRRRRRRRVGDTFVVIDGVTTDIA